MNLAHRPTQHPHASDAQRLLDAVDRHLGDEHSLDTARIHAMLAIADALGDIAAVLDQARQS